MTTLSRLVSSFLLLSAAACGGVASLDSRVVDEEEADRTPSGDGGASRPISGDGDGDGDGVSGITCSPGEGIYCAPPPECVVSYQECLPSGDGWGPCVCEVLSGVGGSHPTSVGDESDFVLGGRGTFGDWDGYLFTAAEAGSTIWPSEIVDSRACVSGTLAPGYEQWAMIGWNIGQDIDPETFQGLTPTAIAPGGIGVEVQVLNPGASGLRVELLSDDLGTESWCAHVPGAGGVIPWSAFSKECWAAGGEPYDRVTPITVVGVLTYAGSDTLPTAFDYCVLHLGPVL